MRLLAITGAVLLGALLILAGALGARWLAPPVEEGAARVELRERGTPGDGPDFNAEIDFQALRELLAVVGPQQRARILESPESFAEFVHQETLNQSVLAAAYANGADRHETIEVLMERAGQRVLAEAYLNQVVRSNLDPDFPSDAQVREAYDKNPDAFRVPERMHLWQIFLPMPETADAASREQTRALAQRIVADLRAGEARFEAMAKQHSAHQASRLNDGYMGLIKVNELVPAVAEAANALEEGAVSDPVASDDGLHIIKRGQAVAAEMLEFEAVAEQVRERLRREAALKIRQAAVEKIADEYPVESPEPDLEQWRERLRSADTIEPAP